MNQEESRQRQNPDREDQIELIFFRVIWKWKWLVIAGTIMCAVVGGGLGFLMPKIYSIDTILQPGLAKIQETGEKIYIDSADNTSALIDAGTFNDSIVKSMKDLKNDDLPKLIKFKTTVKRKSDIIKVSYETSNIDIGIDILNRMNELLLERYIKTVEYYKNEYDMVIQLRKAKLADFREIKRDYEQDIKLSQEKIHELEVRIKTIDKNTDVLMQKRKEILLNTDRADNMLPALLYSNTIQQNLTLSGANINQINKNIARIENDKRELLDLEKKRKEVLLEIEQLEAQKKGVQNIQILQPPISSPYPVRPRKILIITLTSVIGLFGILFIAFLVEYVKNAPKSFPVKKDADF